MGRRFSLAGAFAIAMLLAASAGAEPVVWAIQAEELEYRFGDDSDVFAWDINAYVGKDELKFVWRSEAEYEFEESAFDTLENQLRLQTPISTFFDAVAGVRFDTPDGPNRIFGVLGLHGLAPQFIEVDLYFFVSEEPAARFEAEYEGLITNRIIAVTTLEFDLPFTDDEEVGIGAWSPKLELGLRVSYDLVDRAISPYLGVFYERVFGKSADLARDDGEDVDNLYFLVGTRIAF